METSFARRKRQCRTRERGYFRRQKLRRETREGGEAGGKRRGKRNTQVLFRFSFTLSPPLSPRLPRPQVHRLSSQPARTALILPVAAPLQARAKGGEPAVPSAAVLRRPLQGGARAPRPSGNGAGSLHLTPHPPRALVHPASRPIAPLLPCNASASAARAAACGTRLHGDARPGRRW